MDEALRMLVTQVRGATLDLVEGVPENWLTWAPDGTSNHLLWHAGHALWVQDVLTLKPLNGVSALPSGWETTFGEGCRPPSETNDWPTRTEMAGLLRSQLDGVVEALATHAERLAHADPDERLEHGWPLLAGLVHGWHDEARHQGEMYLLFKMQRAAGRPA